MTDISKHPILKNRIENLEVVTAESHAPRYVLALLVVAFVAVSYLNKRYEFGEIVENMVVTENVCEFIDRPGAGDFEVRGHTVTFPAPGTYKICYDRKVGVHEKSGVDGHTVRKLRGEKC